MNLKKYIVLILFLLIGFRSFSQEPINFETMSHIYDEWKELRHCDTFYYSSKIQPEVIDATIKVITSKKVYTLSDLYMGVDKTPFTLTSDEQVYLISELNKLKAFEWSAGMFPSSKIVALGGTKAVFL